MKEVLIIYAIIQLITTAYGLAVIESIRPMVEKKLKEKGYERNNNSLYTFSNTIYDVVMGFIPFYYLAKALSIITDKNSVDKKVLEDIKNKKYIKEQEQPIIEDEQIDTTDSIYRRPSDYIGFEKPETYKARKNKPEDKDLYATYVTPVEYITRVSKKEDRLNLTPFEGASEVVQRDVVVQEPTNDHIAKAFMELPTDMKIQLAELLNSSIENDKSHRKGTEQEEVISLAKYRESKKREKDVA